MADTIFGLPPDGAIPEGWQALEAICMVKCLDEDGQVTMFPVATPDLNTWEATGMATDLLQRLKDGLRGDPTEDEDDEE